MEVGRDVFCWCGPCGLILGHVIETMKDGLPVKTHCKTCGSRHNYRPYLPGQKPPSLTPKLVWGSGPISGSTQGQPVLVKKTPVMPDLSRWQAPAPTPKELIELADPTAKVKPKSAKKENSPPPLPNFTRLRWQRLCSEPKPVRAYERATRFVRGDLLKHPVFGPGAVMMVSGQKMWVLFEFGEKILVANQGPTS